MFDFGNPQTLSAWAAWTALIITLTPHVYRVVRPGRLDVELAERATIKHAVGRPGMQLIVLLTNSGGTPVRVRRIWVTVQRVGGEEFSIAGSGYFQKPDDQWAVLLAPFRVKANDEWSAHLNFDNPADRDDDLTFRLLSRQLEADIKSREADAAGAILEGPPEVWQPIVDIFNRNFKWRQGEYAATLHVEASRKRASCKREFRFTLFEQDTSDLNVASGYKFGYEIFRRHPNKRGAANVSIVLK